MSKFVDLEDSVEYWFGEGMSRKTRDGVRLTLRFFDTFPGRAPSSRATRMTESDVTRIFEASKSGRGATRTAIHRHGIEIVPDPEPTNAEKIETLMGEAPSSLNRRDLARWLDKRGVKA